MWYEFLGGLFLCELIPGSKSYFGVLTHGPKFGCNLSKFCCVTFWAFLVLVKWHYYEHSNYSVRFTVRISDISVLVHTWPVQFHIHQHVMFTVHIWHQVKKVFKVVWSFLLSGMSDIQIFKCEMLHEIQWNSLKTFLKTQKIWLIQGGKPLKRVGLKSYIHFFIFFRTYNICMLNLRNLQKS
jgi:hypothetical protein